MKQSEFSTGIKSMTKIMLTLCLLLKNGNQGFLIVLESHRSSWCILAKMPTALCSLILLSLFPMGTKPDRRAERGL